MLQIAAEKNFENKIKKFITDNGGYEVKFFANSFTKAGVPDVLACINGKFFGVEVKASSGKPSALQIYNLKEIDKAGGYGLLLYPDYYDLFTSLITCQIQGDYLGANAIYEDFKDVIELWDAKLKMV